MITVESILKKIGCITEMNNVHEFYFDHEQIGSSDKYIEYFRIYAEEGKAVIGSIRNLSGVPISKLDYINNLQFSRNVNTWEQLQ